MKVAIILNGISLKKKFFYDTIVPILSSNFSVDVFETHSKHDAVFLASKAADKKFDVILAAGGDGTLNQVLNGILKGREEQQTLPMLGVIPIGSGNDFARTLQVSTDADILSNLITTNNYKISDVGKINYQDANGKSEISYFINVADAGMGPEVVRRVMNSDRIFGAGFSYYAAILSTFSSYKPMQVNVKTNDWEWTGNLRTLAIGNGRFYGHGLCIAPDAKIDDGNFSTFLCASVSAVEFMVYSTTLKNEKKIHHKKVFYNTTQHMKLTSETPCLIEADGEWLGYLPATIDIIPARIKVICKN